MGGSWKSKPSVKKKPDYETGLPWKTIRFFPLLSNAEMLLGYNEPNLLLGMSILTLFKVVFQALVFLEIFMYLDEF